MRIMMASESCRRQPNRRRAAAMLSSAALQDSKRGEAMPKYMARVSYTAEGVKGLAKDRASGRRAAVAKLLESDGGKLEALYFAFGNDDVISIVDLPNNAAAAAFSLAVNAAGLAELSLTPLLTVEEMDAALGKAVTYRAPGK
jgi:uncharacterized protein with GYD domain